MAASVATTASVSVVVIAASASVSVVATTAAAAATGWVQFFFSGITHQQDFAIETDGFAGERMVEVDSDIDLSHLFNES